MKTKILTTLATLALAVCVWALYYLHALWGAGPIRIGLQIAAALLMVWARITFGLRSFHFTANPTHGELITSGPFRFIRNPIYAAILLFAWAGISSKLTPLTTLIGLVILAMLLLRIFLEEKELTAHYPDYVAYARQTRRLIPFVL